MRGWRRIGIAGLTIVIGCMPGAAQNATQTEVRSTELVVNNHDGYAAVIRRNGRAYVEVEGLARITGATLGFQGNRIVLTLPSPRVAPPPPQPVAAPQPPEEKGFTREFLRAAVEQVTAVREWRSAIENAVRTNNPVEQSWITGYRRNAENRMTMASATASTEADRQMLPLLQSAMGMVQQLSDRFLALRSTVTYVSPDSLNDDPLDQKILSCAQGVTSMAVPGGSFQDVQACH
ncbi:hypothetical protein [Edaphobacter albus]|uniref:hypothetical protein n=1 Tax=Edaphobacter sp. 4G125 TaxID=2763071 RepID=UPI001647175E|nr:hypothetical protein [Edaphobacter sp. 4G125]QNI36120.1 hypothetical protein H7846_14115 [Edaphobacter sp. 4G125]